MGGGEKGEHGKMTSWKEEKNRKGKESIKRGKEESRKGRCEEKQNKRWEEMRKNVIKIVNGLKRKKENK